MKEELQNKLYEKYPKIFRQKDLSPQETCMCWGIACGDGWYNLIDTLCENIQMRVNNVNRARKHRRENSPTTLVPTNDEIMNVEAVQVKEKYGGLRFYSYGGDQYVDGLISMAESMSYLICTECGNAAKPQKPRGWIYTRCNDCVDTNN